MGIVLFKKVWGSDPAEAVDSIKRINSSDLLSAERVVVRATPALVAALAKDQRAGDQIKKRVGSTPVNLISYDSTTATVALHEIESERVRVEDSRELLIKLREVDLTQALLKSGEECVLIAPDDAHFLTPSQKHATKFIRVAEALNHLSSAERVAFWLAPEVATCGGVIADSWALGTTLVMALRLSQCDIPFDCFPAHLQNDEVAARRVVEEVEGRMTGDRPLLFLVSLTSSGVYLRDLQQLVSHTRSQNASRVVPIFSAANAPGEIEALARLPIPLESYDKLNCPYCDGEDRSRQIEIDSKVYYPRVPREENNKLCLGCRGLETSTGVKTEAYSTLVETLASVPGALKIHFDDPNDGVNPRHHAFYLDVRTLFCNEHFGRRFPERLQSKVRTPPTVAVIPPHPAGEVLGATVRALWGCPVIFSHNLRELSTEDRAAICRADHIVVLDDVVITGTRFRNYLRSLRESFSEDDLSGLRTVDWIPVIARPEYQESLAKLRGDLSRHRWENNLVPLFEIELPNWSVEACPWCREAEYLGRQTEAIWDLPNWLLERKEALLTRDQSYLGISPLLRFPGTPIATLAQSSPLAVAGTNERTLLFILAHALQRLRGDPDEPLQRTVWTSSALDFKSCLERFSEPLIQSCLMRAVLIGEWASGTRSSAGSYLADQLSRPRSDILRAESLLFLKRLGHRGALDSRLHDVIAQGNGDTAVRSLLGMFPAG